MRYDPNQHHRRSVRLKWYDYASPGAYFVTLCTQGHVCLVGEAADGEVALNGAGKMVMAAWEGLPGRFSFVGVDTHVVMPNHFHGIIAIEADAPADVDVGAPLVGAQRRVGTRRAATRAAPTLGEVVGAFKSLTTNDYIQGVRELGWQPFRKRLWQRSYYEHVIRNEGDLDHIREYIINNPARWLEDPDHPINAATWGRTHRCAQNWEEYR